jgi:hypothetical protein
MGLVVTIAVVLVAWCVCAVVVGVIVGRVIALKPRGGVRPPEPRRPQASVAPLSASYREGI